MLDDAQVRRAAEALLKHVKSAGGGNPSLLEDDGEVILAQISLHKIPYNVTAKPIPIAIPHPLRRRDDCDMCLFVKDNAKAWIKEMVEKEPVEGLTKVRKSSISVLCAMGSVRPALRIAEPDSRPPRTAQLTNIEGCIYIRLRRRLHHGRRPSLYVRTQYDLSVVTAAGRTT